jgi:hypothetical protein
VCKRILLPLSLLLLRDTSEAVLQVNAEIACSRCYFVHYKSNARALVASKNLHF